MRGRRRIGRGGCARGTKSGVGAGTFGRVSSSTGMYVNHLQKRGHMRRILYGLITIGMLLAAACAPDAVLSTNPTMTPVTIPPHLSEADLKYILLGQYPDFFYCDPDVYPVARAIDPAQLANENFPAIEADKEVFQAILQHNGLTGLTSFTDDQKILVYNDYKKLRAIQLQSVEGAYMFQITVSPSKQQGTLVTGRIDTLGHITVLSQKPTVATCPICLSAQTRIDTPRGPVTVTDLKVGDLVWTLSPQGKRQAEPILEIGSTRVPATHMMVHLVLSDGRELWASPGHPTTDGRHLGDLRVGETFDGTRVTTAELVPYGLTATYDLLPAGGTGYYWANGILLASTLAQP